MFILSFYKFEYFYFNFNIVQKLLFLTLIMNIFSEFFKQILFLYVEKYPNNPMLGNREIVDGKVKITV
jgi:hypothetical protein